MLNITNLRAIFVACLTALSLNAMANPTYYATLGASVLTSHNTYHENTSQIYIEKHATTSSYLQVGFGLNIWRNQRFSWNIGLQGLSSLGQKQTGQFGVIYGNTHYQETNFQYKVSSYALLLENTLHYHFSVNNRFSPFVRLGLGWVNNRSSGFQTTSNDGIKSQIEYPTQNDLAWEIFAGTRYTLTTHNSLAVGVGYRDLGNTAVTLNIFSNTPAKTPLRSTSAEISYRYQF